MRLSSLNGCGGALAVGAAAFGAAAIVVGAVSAHMLGGGPLVDIGLAYHLPHAVAAFAAALVAPLAGAAAACLRWAALLWLLGVCGFSGGLYLHALATLDLGPVVPAGALLMIAGWGFAAAAAWGLARR